MITTFSVKIYPDSAEVAREVLGTTWVGMGPRVAEFEKLVGSRLGLKHPVAVSSGTAALEMALQVCRIGSRNGGSEEDEVITTPNTFIATNSSILRAGAKVVFCDTLLDTYNIDEHYLDTYITKNTRAIMCVHMYGHPCEMNAINNIAEKNRLYVIEDCAHAFDAEYQGRKIGGEDNNIHCYSFQSVKNLTTIEGGMISLPNTIMYEEAIRLRWFGVERDDPRRKFDGTYDLPLIGQKGNMTDVYAAIGLGQLKHIDEDNEYRINMVGWYNELLSERVEKPTVSKEVKHAWHAYTIMFSGRGLRDRVITELKKEDIQTMLLYRPHYLYKQFPALEQNKMSMMHYEKSLTLPFHMNLSYDDIVKTCEVINRVVG